MAYYHVLQLEPGLSPKIAFCVSLVPDALPEHEGSYGANADALRASTKEGRPVSPSEQHERWRLDLLRHLERKLNGCSWCALGLRQEHPPRCYVPLQGTASSWQMVTWPCEQLHAHFYDLLPDAHQVVGEKPQSAPSGRRCRPDITVLDGYGEPLAFIEVVRTHLSEQAVAVAKELDIPLFVIPAPDENVVRPALGAARPWWESVPGFPDRDFARAVEAFIERRAAETATELEWFSEHETVEDEHGNVVLGRFRGSAPDLASMAYPAIGTALVADSCTWSCARAAAALRAQDG